jgi:NAD(P)-dependent dehydrogenase (short-subunit alcohol dehydrogenase family)
MISYNPFSLEGRTVLITGASSGIGRMTAIECSKMGAKVILTGRNKDRLEETFCSLSGNGHHVVLCDLSNEESIDALVEEVPAIDGLVNNAGYIDLIPIKLIKSQRFKAILATNTIAPILLLQKLLRKKKITNNSSIVFTSSLAGLGYGTVGNSMYSASKGAISSFIRVASKELASRRIRVNAVCPGMVKTDIMSKGGGVSNQQLEDDEKKYPLGYGEPIDIALAIIYLLSNASKWMTGTNLIIDGGIS